MVWRIEVSASARKQLGKLGHSEAKRIRDYLRIQIEPLENPRAFGKPLKGSNLWRYRVGNYRLICDLRDGTLVVLVVRIGHRREVYRAS